MSVRDKLASALDRRDEEPNIALARELAQSRDKSEIAALSELLTTGTKPERHDAIKVLYELGERAPELISPHLEVFLALLTTRDNRMLWGALSAIDTLGATCPDKLMPQLDRILDAADRSSVIAKDKTMHLLATLNGHKKFSPIIEPVLFERLKHAAVNQFPMYAEFAATTVSANSRSELMAIIKDRSATISYPAKKARLEKLLWKMQAS